MSWGSWASVHFPETVVDRRGNILVVLLQEHEVRITLDTNVGKLDPLVVGDAHLLEVLDEAVVVRDMGAGFACDHDVGHLAELGELVDGASLEYAGALGWLVGSNLSGSNNRAVRYWWIELQRCVCETTRPSSGTTNPSNGRVSDQRSKRNVARLNVDVGTQQIRACV
mgnify:CR=1 FL=1